MCCARGMCADGQSKDRADANVFLTTMTKNSKPGGGGWQNGRWRGNFVSGIVPHHGHEVSVLLPGPRPQDLRELSLHVQHVVIVIATAVELLLRPREASDKSRHPHPVRHCHVQHHRLRTVVERLVVVAEQRGRSRLERRGVGYGG